MKRVLIIAGSDSGGGAGIQADLKTVSALGVWGSTAITALTAQNTRTVAAIHEVPASFVTVQIRTVLEDIDCDAIKVGMLHSARIVRAVAEAVPEGIPLVLDPVMTAKGGQRLLSEEAAEALKETLLPRSFLVTPNIPEAEELSGIKISSVRDMEQAAERILERGPEAVLVKGGHMEGPQVVDILAASGKIHRFTHGRLSTRNTHGTGCTLSSAAAAFLALGEETVEAVRKARRFVRSAMRAGPAVGEGNRPLDHLWNLKREAERYRVIKELERAFESLKELGFVRLVPEVQSNLAYALPWAEEFEDVAAFPGRIVRLGDSIAAPAGPEFGASRHVARVVLTAMALDGAFRSCLNIRYGSDVLGAMEKGGLTAAHFDRAEEPPDKKAREGSTLEWGTWKVLEELGKIPDAVCDRGETGKEPMVRLLARTPGEIVEKVRRILENLS